MWLESPTNPALEVADIPTIRGRRARRRRVRRRRQHVRHSPAPAAARRWAPTWSCTRRRSSSSGHSDVLLGAVVTRDDAAVRRAQGPARPGRRDPRDRSRPGSPCAACAPCTCGSSAPRPTPRSWSAGSRPTRPSREVRYPGFGGDRVDRAGAGRARRRPAHPQDEAVGARHLPRRRRVDVRAPPPLEDRAAPPSPTAWCGCRSASRTSTTSGPTSRRARQTSPDRRWSRCELEPDPEVVARPRVTARRTVRALARFEPRSLARPAGCSRPRPVDRLSPSRPWSRGR